MKIINDVVTYVVPFIPRLLLKKVANRYIGGNDLASVLERVRQLNAQGFTVTLDILGESVTNTLHAQHMADEYIKVLKEISNARLDAEISIKPTALGLLLDEKLCVNLTENVISSAMKYGNSVCFDMEDVQCTEKEIILFTNFKKEYANISLAVQAYLKRTYSDIDRLTQKKSKLRICKGIYMEDHILLVDDAWHDRTAINSHFLSHVERCFEAGAFLAVATHDIVLINQIIELAKNKNIDRDMFEFQLLLGVCEPLRDKLLEDGFQVRIYVPFGRDWYEYSIRRLKENPSIASHIIKSLFLLT
jgi:proline dehydrogenase